MLQHKAELDAVVKEQKCQKREEHELAEHPTLDLSDEAKDQAVADALDCFLVELARLRQQYPGRVFSVNISDAGDRRARLVGPRVARALRLRAPPPRPARRGARQRRHVQGAEQAH
mmetsp:Transcript_25416/g.85682  ORF Transcript_25416/g.85682 Transcript_25416/m.85682 type:complete len:116 (+) Transcript_25416:516-863(+)